MKENKYYTPDISELHIGYECEWLDTRNDWVGLVIKLTNDISTEDTYRTKYLDSDDIISLGFEEKRKTIDSIIYHKKDFFNFPYGLWLKHKPNSNCIVLDNDECYSDNDTYFQGLCKSKNELKKILEWIK